VFLVTPNKKEIADKQENGRDKKIYISGTCYEIYLALSSENGAGK